MKEIIKKWIDQACNDNFVPELSNKIDFEFNSRFTRKLGDACFFRNTGRGRIRLSGPLWERATDTQRYETVIHETCHVIVRYKFKHNIKPHGIEWKTAMMNCNVRPKRTHNVDRTGLKRKKVKYVISNCPNDGLVNAKCFVGKINYKKLKNGTTFACSKCSLVVDTHFLKKEE